LVPIFSSTPCSQTPSVFALYEKKKMAECGDNWKIHFQRLKQPSIILQNYKYDPPGRRDISLSLSLSLWLYSPLLNLGRFSVS
jgi:hypothetical protein